MGKAELELPIANYVPVDDEIDLLELVQAVLKTWKVAFIAIVIVTLGFILYQVLAVWRQPQDTTYSKIIQLTFKGVNQNSYPNGARFRLQDILAPAVLESVYELHQEKLQAANIGIERFYQRLSISPYTPEYELIVKKYDAMLEEINDRNIRVNDLEAIRQKQEEELQNTQKGKAKLTFDAKGIAADRSLISSILTTIPAEWARLQIEDKGVLKFNLDLPSSLVLDASMFKTVDYVVLNDLVNDKINLLRDGIGRLAAKDNVSAAIKDPVTHMSLADLRQVVDDFRIYVVDNIMSPVRRLGLTKDREFSTFYYDEKKRKLEERLDYLAEEATLVKAALSEYSDSGDGVSKLELPSGQVSPQLSGEFLDRLVNMSSKNTIEKYRQDLNNRWLQANIDAANIKSRLREINQVIELMRDQGENLQINQQYLQRVDDKIPNIVQQLQGYYDALERIAALAGGQSIGGLGYLYKEVHGDVLRQSNNHINSKRILIQFVALVFMTTVLVVPAMMIRNALKSRAQTPIEPNEVSVKS